MHTHMPFVNQVRGIEICNAGSVGFNLDGDPRAAWLSVEAEGVQEAYKQMIRTGIYWRNHLPQ